MECFFLGFQGPSLPYIPKLHRNDEEEKNCADVPLYYSKKCYGKSDVRTFNDCQRVSGLMPHHKENLSHVPVSVCNKKSLKRKLKTEGILATLLKIPQAAVPEALRGHETEAH